MNHLGHWYLKMCHVCVRGLWVRAALVRGDGVDAGQNDGVLLLQYVPVVEGVFLRRLHGSEVAVAMLKDNRDKGVR